MSCTRLCFHVPKTGGDLQPLSRTCCLVIRSLFTRCALIAFKRGLHQGDLGYGINLSDSIASSLKWAYVCLTGRWMMGQLTCIKQPVYMTFRWGTFSCKKPKTPLKVRNKKGLTYLTRQELPRQTCSRVGLPTGGLSISLLCYPWLVGGDSPCGLKVTNAIPGIACLA